MWRPPVHLLQPDENACVSSIVANLLYMFYLTDAPDIAWVDQQLKRQPNGFVREESQDVFLLDQGLSLLAITDDSASDLLNYGIDYMKYRYQNLWHEEWDQIFTPEVIRQTQALTARTEQEIANRQLPRTVVPRPPTFDDLIQLVDAGYVVELATREGNSPYTHGMLVYKHEWYTVAVYEPCLDGATLFNLGIDGLAKSWDCFWLKAWSRRAT